MKQFKEDLKLLGAAMFLMLVVMGTFYGSLYLILIAVGIID